MKIKEISTRQFAGIKNRQMNFEDGLNIVVGENESGKSTMVEVIKQILFRRSVINRTKDKDFLINCMPSGGKGDVVDGRLVYEGKNGRCELQKRWGSKPDCELVDAGGNIIADEDTISGIIGEELVYKKGLYDDVVFASQKNQESVVEHILSRLDKNNEEKQDIVSILAAESMASAGGILPEDIERKISEKIEGLSGNWDFTINAPKGRRGIDKPWKVGVGEILKAYYKLAETEQILNRSEQAETAMDQHSAAITDLKTKKTELEQELNEYRHYETAIKLYNKNQDVKKSKLREKEIITGDRSRYEKVLDDHTKARELQRLKEARDAISRYSEVTEAKKKLDENKRKLADCTVVTDDDVKLFDATEISIGKLEAKLNGLNLTACIEKLGDADIEVRSLLTGTAAESADGRISIKEAVEISIPGIARISLVPEGIDINAVRNDLQDNNKKKKEILEKTGAADRDELVSLKDRHSLLVKEAADAELDYNEKLNGEDYSVLEAGYNEKKHLESECTELEDKIRELCGTTSLEGFSEAREQQIAEIEGKYKENDPLGDMDEKLAEIDKELKSINEQEGDAVNIPEKYRSIENAETFSETLEERIKDIEDNIEDETGKLHDAEKELVKELGDDSVEEFRTRREEAEDHFNQKKAECKRWMHILEVLKNVKSSMKEDSAMDDLQKRFAEYLSEITKGGVKLDSMDEKMDLSISSGDMPMTYELLSEGTKGTIALAFRLAMLDHLFPEGGGLAVFDDPFTEMDEERTKISCRLVQEFAQKGNQVIFTTCDPKYLQLMSGNVINIQH